MAFDDVITPTQAAPAASPAKPASSLFNDVILPADPERAAYLQNLSIQANKSKAAAAAANTPSAILAATAKGTVSTLVNGANGIIGGIVDQYTKPDSFEQSMEQDIPNIPVVKQVDQAALRTAAPVIKPLVTDAAAAIIFNNKGLTDMFNTAVAEGKGDKESQQAVIAATQKSAPQIVGDVAQAVLGAYTPEFFGEGAVAEGGIKEALTVNAAKGASYGFTFGVAQAASSGSKDPKEIASTILRSTVAGAFLSAGITAVSHGLARTVPEALSKAKQAIPVPEKELDIAGGTEAGQTESQELFHGANKEVTTANKQYQNVLDFKNDQQDVIKNLAANGDAEAQQLIDEAGTGKVAYSKADQLIRQKYGDTYDAVRYNNEQMPQKGVEYHDLAENKFYTPSKDYANIHAMQTGRSAKYEAPKGSNGGNFSTVDGEGKPIKSTLGVKVEQNAIEHKLVDSFGDLPEYNRVSMKVQAQRATDLIEQDPDRAMRVAMGQEAAPQGVLPESVYVAVESHALKTGDVETLRNLATKSHLVSEATIMGQRIRTLGERDQASPIEAIRQVKKAREAAYKKKTGTEASEGIKKEANAIRKDITKNAPTRQSWEDFIDEIKCNY